MKYVPYKDRKPLMKDLKSVYQALTIEEAELAFGAFKEKWGKKYPMIVKSWENNWLELTTHFSYPRDIRRLIYTTNTVEGYHRQLRKVTKTKTAYPSDDALRKIIYLATHDGHNQEMDYAGEGMGKLHVAVHPPVWRPDGGG